MRGKISETIFLLVFLAVITSCVRITSSPRNTLLNKDLDEERVHSNSLYRIGWLTSLYIGMTDTAFLDYWNARSQSYKKELLYKFSDSLDQQINTRQYNGNPDPLYADIIPIEKLKEIPVLRKRRTMQFYEGSDTLNHLPTFKNKDFIFYEITDKNFPKVMKLLYQRTSTIDTTLIDDIIAKATFWFDKKDKKLFRVDISLKNESTKNIKKIIKLTTGELPTRNTVKFLNMFDEEFDSYATNNDRKFLLDDLYTIARGESDDGIIERKKSIEAKKYKADSTKASLQKELIFNLINYYNENKTTSIDQKYCNEIQGGFYDSLYSDKPWIMPEVRSFLEETGACNEQDQLMKMSNQLDDIEKYFEKELRRKLDNKIDSNILIIEEFRKFKNRYTSIPYRYKNYLEEIPKKPILASSPPITPPSSSATRKDNKNKRKGKKRTRKFNKEFELIKDFKEVKDVKNLFTDGIYRRNILRPHFFDFGKKTGKNKWLKFRSNTDLVVTRIEFAIDSLLKTNINYDLMKYYYSSVIYSIKHKKYEELDEVYCPLLQFHPIKVVLNKNNKYSQLSQKNKSKNLSAIYLNMDSIKDSFIDIKLLGERLQTNLASKTNAITSLSNSLISFLNSGAQNNSLEKLTYYNNEKSKGNNQTIKTNKYILKLISDPIKKADSLLNSMVFNLDVKNPKNITSSLEQTVSIKRNTNSIKELLNSTIVMTDRTIQKFELANKYVDSITINKSKSKLYSEKIKELLTKQPDTTQQIAKNSELAQSKLNVILKTPNYSDSIPYFYEFYPTNFEESLEKSYYKVDSIFYIKVMNLFNESCLCSPNDYNCLEENDGLIAQIVINFKKYIRAFEKEQYNATKKITAVEIPDKVRKKSVKKGIKAWSYSGLFGEEIQLFICSHPKKNPLKIHYERTDKKIKYPAISIYDRNKISELLIHKTN